jgi:hypothetical protein
MKGWDRSPIESAMERYGAPATRDEYIAWNWHEGYIPTPEEEQEMPERFQLASLNEPPISEEIQ